jgi:hypothetical protein
MNTTSDTKTASQTIIPIKSMSSAVMNVLKGIPRTDRISLSRINAFP